MAITAAGVLTYNAGKSMTAINAAGQLPDKLRHTTVDVRVRFVTLSNEVDLDQSHVSSIHSPSCAIMSNSSTSVAANTKFLHCVHEPKSHTFLLTCT